MERIKNLDEVVLRGDGLLAELVEKKSKSGLILPESMDNSDFADYIKVIAVGNKVEDIAPGDIILDVGGGVSTFLIKDRRFAIIYRNTITLSVKPENFDVDSVEEEINDSDIKV